MALTDNLVSYYKLDGNSTDAVGSNNGTDTAITYSAGNGKIVQGAGFNGTSSKIRLPGTFSDFGTGGFSINVWFKKAANGIDEAFFYRQDDTTHNAFINFSITSGNVLFAQIRGTEANLGTLNGTTTITDTNWHLATLTSAGSGSTINLYLDNSLEDTDTLGTVTLNFGSAVPSIGQYFQGWISGEGWYFNGALDEFGIWSRALSSTEVTELYNAGAGIQYPFSTANTTNFFQFIT